MNCWLNFTIQIYYTITRALKYPFTLSFNGEKKKTLEIIYFLTSLFLFLNNFHFSQKFKLKFNFWHFLNQIWCSLSKDTVTLYLYYPNKYYLQKRTNGTGLKYSLLSHQQNWHPQKFYSQKLSFQKVRVLKFDLKFK